MESIMRMADLDFDGQVQFTEFLIAACGKKSLLTAQNLEKAFASIDSNADGKLCTDDVSEYLGSPISQHQLMLVLGDATSFDEFDGKLDFRDFETVMNRILNASEKYLRSA